MEPMSMILAAIIAFVSGIVGGMVGGSYLILIPGLLFLGLDIHHVIGITKLTSISFGLVFVNYLRGGKVDLRFSWPFAMVMVFGSILGSFFVIGTKEHILQKVIGVLMLIIACFMLFNRNFGVKPIKIDIRKRNVTLAVILFFFLGIYHGFYGAAASVLIVMVLSSLLKKEFVESIGNARFLEFGAAIPALVIFAAKGLIDYKLAIPIAILYFIGAWFGSCITLKKGSAWIRYPLIVVAIAFAIKMLFF